jgi:hypothetical protein
MMMMMMMMMMIIIIIIIIIKVAGRGHTIWHSNPSRDKTVISSPKLPDRRPVQCIPGTGHTASNTRGLLLTTRIHLVFRLRMSGTEPLSSMYAFGAGVEIAATTTAAAQFRD